MQAGFKTLIQGGDATAAAAARSVKPGSADARRAVFTKNIASCDFFLANAVCWCCAWHPAMQAGFKTLIQGGDATAAAAARSVKPGSADARRALELSPSGHRTAERG
jgi:hypothetical protein